MTYDTKGTLADLCFFVEAGRGNVALREEWIARLEAGEDPAVIFDTEMLEELKHK